MTSLAGSFLVARTTLRDSFFGQTVILMLQHGPEGAFGLIVNRRGKGQNLPFPVFVGGPCEAPGLLMLHGHEDWLTDKDNQEIAPGVFLGDAETFLRLNDTESSENPHDRVRMFSGYSGWGPDQLEGEMAQGSWAVVPASGDLVFDTPPQELWEQLVPPSFPQFSVN